jgi:hypothetical protein
MAVTWSFVRTIANASANHGQANSAGMTESGETDFRDAEGDER